MSTPIQRRGFLILLSMFLGSCLKPNHHQVSDGQAVVQQEPDAGNLPMGDPLPDSCPERQIGKYHLVCYGYSLEVTGGKIPWQRHFDGSDVRVFPLNDRVLLVQAAVSGALSFIEGTVVDLNDGHVLMDNDGGLIYLDDRTAVFAATGTASGRAAYAPTLYLMNLKTLVTVEKVYSIHPRTGCGVNEDDVSWTREGEGQIVMVRGGRLVFQRVDRCGPFEFTAPLRAD